MSVGGSCASAPPLPHGSQRNWCGVLEDEGRIADRGFAVLRGFVPESELRQLQMATVKLAWPLPALCGVPYEHINECRYSSGDLRDIIPESYAKLDRKLNEWSQNGTLGLGAPLEVVGAELIAINRWKLRHNSSCLLSALFDASIIHRVNCMDERCPDEDRDDSLGECWQLCAYDALAHRTNTSVVRATLDAVEASKECPVQVFGGVRYAVLDGPIDSVLGATGQFDFGQHGRMRLRALTSLRAWLTRNVPAAVGSLYNGFHDWHVDGPASLGRGREHKAFVIVSKGNLRDRAMHANVRVIPNHAKFFWETPELAKRLGLSEKIDASSFVWRVPRIAGCGRSEHCTSADGVVSEADRVKGRSIFAASWPKGGWGGGSWESRLRQIDEQIGEHGDGAAGPLSTMNNAIDDRSRIRRLHAWGVPEDWPRMDRLGCDVPLEPGDVLFWREDVWHRTQDSLIDRLALRIDILRPPFPTDVEGLGG